MNTKLYGSAQSARLKGAPLARMFACSISLAAMAIGLTGPAHAQTAEQPQASETGGVAEIVVTAQKREQRLQDVPIAITALTQDTLQANRVQSVNDLTGLAPGLLSRENAGSLGSPSFSMRGVFSSASQPSQDKEISQYLDGVYIGANRGSVFDLPDVERIEVLRGPQGTLFGRNATAGAISVITRDPTGEFHARQEVTVGNYSQLRTRTTIDTPQIGPFSAYITYVHDQRRGDVRNLGAGTQFDYSSPFNNYGVRTSPKYLGSRNFNDIFAALKFTPTDNFTMTYKFDRSVGTATPNARGSTVINPNSFVGSMLEQIIAAQPAGGGAFGPFVQFPDNKRPKAVNNAWTMPGFASAHGHNLTTQWQISDNLSVKNITAYRYSSVYGPSTIMGIDGLQFTQGAVLPYAQFAAISSVPGFTGLPAATQAGIVANIAGALQPAVGSYFAGYEGNSYGRSNQVSSETQLNYQSRLLTLTVGGIWYHSNDLNSGLPGYPPNPAFAPVPFQLPLGNVQEVRSRTTSIAAYAQAEVHVTSQIDIVAGGRVTKDKKTGSFTTGGVFTGTRTDGIITGEAVQPFSFRKTQPTFSIGANYKPNRDILLYGKYSTAYLSGGAVGPLSFKQETVRSEELGVKADLLDRRLRVNLALYNAHYRNTQSSQSGSNIVINGVPQSQYGVLVVNNGPLKARGVELEVTAAPTTGLTLGGSVGYTHAKLTNPNPLVAAGNPYLANGVAPWIASANAQYQTQPLFDDAYMFFRIDANYTGQYRAIPNPNISTQIPVFGPYEFVPSAWIMNGRIALRDMKVGRANAEIGVWAKNLTNNRTTLYELAFGDIQIDSSYQPARTFGVDFIVSF